MHQQASIATDVYLCGIPGLFTCLFHSVLNCLDLLSVAITIKVKKYCTCRLQEQAETRGATWRHRQLTNGTRMP